jgi:4-azaleucine resistance transporter AzlC
VTSHTQLAGHRVDARMAPMTPLSYPLSPRQQFVQGIRAQIPTLPGIIPFGLAAGAYTASVLGQAGQAAALQSLMFAGRGQMVAMQMLREGAPLLLMMLATLIVNLRNMMYAASLTRHINHLSWPWRFLLAFFIVDNVYAFSIQRLNDHAATHDARTRHYFLLGGGLFTLTFWTLGGLLGAIFGQSIPPAWGLDVVPHLSFLYVLSIHMRDRVDWVAGIASALVATLLAGLPWQLGLFAGAAVGLTAGMLFDRGGQNK